MRKLIIVGAGEQAMLAAGILGDRFELVGYLDDDPRKEGVLDRVYDSEKYIADHVFFVSFGDNAYRRQAYRDLELRGATFVNAIHPKASIEEGVSIGENVFIGAHAFVNMGSKIGDNVIINSRCLVEHDNVIGDHTHLTPGVVTGGGVVTGEAVFVGLRAVVNDHLHIGDNAVVGSGAVVTRDVEPNVTVVGIPARPVTGHRRVASVAAVNPVLRRAIFLGREPAACHAVEFLLSQGISVPLIVAPSAEGPGRHRLRDAAARYDIPLLTEHDHVYRMIEEGDSLVREIDLVVSFLYWRRIREPLFRLPRYGCINFHPAPLPDYKSRAGYNNALLERRREFGVSAHFIDSQEFDAGPIIEVQRFPIDPDHETAHSLATRSHAELLELFKRTIRRLVEGAGHLPTTPNEGGLYLNKEQVEQLKRVDLSDPPEELHRKARAFFFPPYSGATVRLGGDDFTLVDAEILEYIDRVFRRGS